MELPYKGNNTSIKQTPQANTAQCQDLYYLFGSYWSAKFHRPSPQVLLIIVNALAYPPEHGGKILLLNTLHS